MYKRRIYWMKPLRKLGANNERAAKDPPRRHGSRKDSPAPPSHRRHNGRLVPRPQAFLTSPLETTNGQKRRRHLLAGVTPQVLNLRRPVCWRRVFVLPFFSFFLLFSFCSSNWGRYRSRIHGEWVRSLCVLACVCMCVCVLPRQVLCTRVWI